MSSLSKMCFLTLRAKIRLSCGDIEERKSPAQMSYGMLCLQDLMRLRRRYTENVCPLHIQAPLLGLVEKKAGNDSELFSMKRLRSIQRTFNAFHYSMILNLIPRTNPGKRTSLIIPDPNL